VAPQYLEDYSKVSKNSPGKATKAQDELMQSSDKHLQALKVFLIVHQLNCFQGT